MEYTLSDRIKQMRNLLILAEIEIGKFEKGKTTGTRIRKYMQNIKYYAQDVRQAITDMRKAEKEEENNED